MNPTHPSPEIILLFILAIEYLDAIWLRRIKRRVLFLLARKNLAGFLKIIFAQSSNFQVHNFAKISMGLSAFSTMSLIVYNRCEHDSL